MLNVKPKILLIEDDESLGYLLSQYLTLKNFEIHWEKNGKSGLKALDAEKFDLLILDVSLPDINGFEIAEKLRTKYENQPFLFLTARTMKIDLLRGFSLGAVDYLKKPIDEEELVARINSLLKLTSRTTSIPQMVKYDIGDYSFNRTLNLLSINQKEVSLTEREAEVLQFLVERKNNLADHRELLTKIWGKNDYFNKKSLNVFVSRLRKYLKNDPRISIDNVHNKGFILKIDE